VRRHCVAQGHRTSRLALSLTSPPSLISSPFERPRSLYFCKRDSRLWVPKRLGWGWTINLGHPAGGFILLAVIVIPAILQAVVIAFAVKGACNCDGKGV
jgi:hypothetical protein